jgi:hypothetical protein
VQQRTGRETLERLTRLSQVVVVRDIQPVLHLTTRRTFPNDLSKLYAASCTSRLSLKRPAQTTDDWMLSFGKEAQPCTLDFTVLE